MKQLLILLLAAATLSACAGLDITPISPKKVTKAHNDQAKLHGYIVYEPIVAVEIGTICRISGSISGTISGPAKIMFHGPKPSSVAGTASARLSGSVSAPVSGPISGPISANISGQVSGTVETPKKDNKNESALVTANVNADILGKVSGSLAGSQCEPGVRNICSMGSPFLLPDMSRPFLVNSRAGLGSTDVKLTIKDGWRLESVENNTDNTKILDFINTLLQNPRFNAMNNSEAPPKRCFTSLYTVQFDASSAHLILRRIALKPAAGTAAGSN